MSGETCEHVMHDEVDNRKHDDDSHYRVSAHRGCCTTGEPFEKTDFVQPICHGHQAANQINTFQACLWPSTSSHPTMRVTTINERTSSATVVALIMSPPKIQRPRAKSASSAIDASLKVIPPIFLSSSAAQTGTSGLFFSSGG